MGIVLRAMTEGIFKSYMREHEEEYARDRMITDHESFEAALEMTRRQHEKMLPDGVRTSGHYFFAVHDEQTGKHVGYVWFASRPPTLSLYHILIHPADRRRGYGRAVLQAVEQRARELSCEVIWLNVMGHNRQAVEFYEACGYRVAAMHMNKFLNRA